MGERAKLYTVVAGVVSVIVMSVGFVADVLGIRSALTDSSGSSGGIPTPIITYVLNPPPTLPPTSAPATDEPTTTPSPSPIATTSPIVDPSPQPESSTGSGPDSGTDTGPGQRGPDACVVGTWSMTAITMNDTYPAFGDVHMIGVQGTAIISFRSDGTWASTTNFVVEGRSASGDVIARGISGTGDGRFTTADGELAETNVRSVGWNYLWRNHQQIDQRYGPILVDGTAAYECSSTTLSIDGANYHEEFRRS